jgi:hypothetical protein
MSFSYRQSALQVSLRTDAASGEFVQNLQPQCVQQTRELTDLAINVMLEELECALCDSPRLSDSGELALRR